MKYIVKYQDKDTTGYVVQTDNDNMQFDYGCDESEAFKFVKKESAQMVYDCIFKGMDDKTAADWREKVIIIGVSE